MTSTRASLTRATQAIRQPGSNFKPFVYTTALENGFTAASIINDAPVVFEDKQLESYWRPENDSGKFYGPTRLRKALYLSRNLVSIRILRSLGINKAINGLGRFGFNNSSELPRDLSLVLGSYATTPLKIVTGYATFANGGFKVEPHLISHITDHTGKIVYQAAPPTVCRDCKEGASSQTANASENNTDTVELPEELVAALEQEATQLNPGDISITEIKPAQRSEGD